MKSKTMLSYMKYHVLEDFHVRFSETDAAGVVHFSNFLRWAENAEGDFFRKNGLSLIVKDDAGAHIGWPKVNVFTNFKAPARYADCIRVKIRPQETPSPSAHGIAWEFIVCRVEKDGAEAVLAEGGWKSVFAVIDASGKIRLGDGIPASVLVAIEKLTA